MTNTLHSTAVFRLSVLGPLISRDKFEHGEFKYLLREIASRPHDIPGNVRCYLSEKTIEAWFYAWKKGGIEALVPKRRCDWRMSKLDLELQEHILRTKRENPKRSLDELRRLLEVEGVVAKGQLKRTTLHRLLKRHNLSRPPSGGSELIERRSYEAERASDIWYGDVMHGPKVVINGRLRKAYLVSLMDDASRLVAHSAFCPGETALDIEGVLKQALLRRGLPCKLIVDQGAAYRAESLQCICARLSITLIYCRPYEPQAKGKLERWHRVVRDQFLSELTSRHLQSLETLNSALWAWIEGVYHQRYHSALGCSPLSRWQRDLETVRPLKPFVTRLDELFYHREKRKVRKDGTVSFQGHYFEVPYRLTGTLIQLVVDPQAGKVVGVESLDGEHLGEATPLNRLSNNHRRRHRSQPEKIIIDNQRFASTTEPFVNAVDQAMATYVKPLKLTEEE